MTRRHAVATLTAIGTVSLLAVVIAANGYDDFGSAFWWSNAASVGALFYLLAVLISRSLDFAEGVWRRVAAFGFFSGAVLSTLIFVRLETLNASGVAVALILTLSLGATLGLTAVEGLRWVLSGDPEAGRPHHAR